MSHVGPGWSTDVAHALLRAVSRLISTPALSWTRCASHARGPGVEKSLDAARRSACATSATTCPILAHPVLRDCADCPRHQAVSEPPFLAASNSCTLRNAWIADNS